MDNQFKSVTLDLSNEFYKLWDKTPQKSLDYTLTNLWGWQEYYGLEWRFDQKLCWIRQTKPSLIYWAPIGAWHEIDWAKALPKTFRDENRNFWRVPEELVTIWQKHLNDKVEVKDDRGQWEYLYLQKDLATLSGSKFHKKKNHLNSYIKTYGEPDYHEITPDLVKSVLKVQDVWCHWHECEDSPSLLAENEAINRVLTHWSNFRNLKGGSLYVDGKMIAFSVGEQLNKDTLGTHFEKGLNGYRGVYQAMNYEFARHAGEGYTYINRAQDLDEDGLRQAKMTYLPAGFLKKFMVLIKK